MPKKLDPVIADILKSFGFGPEACWDCHGTWVVYHKVLEQIAAKASIVFEPPQVIEARSADGIVAVCVTGRRESKSEWSFGEAAPKNNKTAYPYAMAEKRAKDRVILKLIGLHGLAYSEEEADDFKAAAPAAIVSATRTEDLGDEGPTESEKRIAAALKTAIDMAKTWPDLNVWKNAPENVKLFQQLPDGLRKEVTDHAAKRKEALAPQEVAA